MVRIAISQAAFDAIASTMALGSFGFENARAPNNEVYVWLDHATVAKLRHLRGPGGGCRSGALSGTQTKTPPGLVSPWRGCPEGS
jgi:hypothetical protein